jgi:hypothetical protein
MPDRDTPASPAEILAELGAKWSPAFSRPGPLTITAYDCAICSRLDPGTPCRCHEIEFGSAEYLARLDRLHGRPARPVPQKLDGCTCGGIGDTGAHRQGCPWVF